MLTSSTANVASVAINPPGKNDNAPAKVPTAYMNTAGANSSSPPANPDTTSHKPAASANQANKPDTRPTTSSLPDKSFRTNADDSAEESTETLPLSKIEAALKVKREPGPVASRKNIPAVKTKPPIKTPVLAFRITTPPAANSKTANKSASLSVTTMENARGPGTLCPRRPTFITSPSLPGVTDIANPEAKIPTEIPMGTWWPATFR